ncbi:MAG: SDR family oxidoreductase [Kiritimatiellae bacterium]|nr:SDR family oxidoreductase [Kiritimatiellia bacterium]
MINSFFQDKVAVVTGAGGTLCSVIAKHLASLGCKVVLVGRTREKLEKVAQSLDYPDSRALSRVEPCDVTDEAAVNALAARVMAEWGPCRFLINGAGGNNIKAMPTRLRFSTDDLFAIGSRSHDSSGPRDASAAQAADTSRGFFDIDMEAFKSVLEINTLGTVIPSRAFGLQMAAAGGGAIINFGSMNTYRPLTRVAPYAMAKAAIANWTMFFAQYMAPAHVRVNAIAPGFMVNDRSRKYLCTPDGGLSARGEQVMAHTPMGRFGEAADLLGCVDWLLDDTKSAFVTGITVPVDGGFLASAGV